MKFEFVTHCWQYWRCLTYQVSSFLLEPPKDSYAILSVVYCPDDEATTKRLEQIGAWMSKNGCPENFELRLHPLEKSMLFRRSIGRNMLALNTEADWVWFCDCDMTFKGSAIDALAEELDRINSEDPDMTMVYPKRVRCTSQPAGDELIYSIKDEFEPVALDYSSLGKKTYHAAIGGAQIVRQDVCHEEGYLDKYPQFRRPEYDHWKRTKEDPIFRRRCIGHRGLPVRNEKVVTGVARIRHTQRGRFDIGLEM